MGKKTSMYLTDDLSTAFAFPPCLRYLCGMDGYKRTSVHLPAELAERVDGMRLPDLIRKGLDAEPLEAMLRRVIREELAAALGAKAQPASPVTVPFREPGQ
jgi:hypothetical protein